MVAVIFEVTLRECSRDEYHALGQSIRQALSAQPGFLGGSSYRSAQNENVELSINYWADEASAAQWRNHAEHRLRQSIGRERLFQSYRVTVLQTIRTYTQAQRNEAPADSNQYFFPG